MSEIQDVNPESVEAMLDHELANTIEAEAQQSMAQAAADAPYINIQIHGINKDNLSELQSALAKCGVGFQESDLYGSKLQITQLHEAWAVQVMQCLIQVGFHISAYRQSAFDTPIMDSPSSEYVQEGAPAIELPKGAQEVLLSSANDVLSMPVLRTLGIVSAHKSIARRFFKEQDLQESLEQELRKMRSSFVNPFASSSLERVLRELFSELQRKALGLGGNAVLGIRLDCHIEDRHMDESLNQMRLIAIGTATVVEN